MQTQKYSIQQPLIESLLSWVKEGEIAIPEIQRPVGVSRRAWLRRHRRFAPPLRAQGSRSPIRRCTSVGDFVQYPLLGAPRLAVRYPCVPSVPDPS